MKEPGAPENDGRLVFWINAGSVGRVREGFRAIADAAKLPSQNLSEADVFQVVFRWLNNEANRSWCMILDDADELDVFFNERSEEAGGRPLAAYLPRSPNGSILVTTRRQEVAARLTEDQDAIIEVGEMTQGDALSLFEKRSAVQHEESTVAELMEGLALEPLSISLAAAYMRQVDFRMSVKEYMDKLRGVDHRGTGLARHDGLGSEMRHRASDSVWATWRMSFEYIRAKRPYAADLLSLMSCFDRQGIPRELLDTHNEARSFCSQEPSSDSSSQSADELKSGFNEDVQVLQDFGLIAVDEEKNLFSLHNHVQESTITWLRARGELEMFRQDYVELLATAFPVGDFPHWETCEKLALHVEVAVNYQPEDQISLMKWASLLHKGAWYAWERGRYATAARMIEKARQTREQVLGLEHEETLASMGMHGLLLNDMGFYEQAEKLHAFVTEKSQRLLGEEHPGTLLAMSSLAATYQSQSRLGDAAALSIRVMESRKRVLGENHRDTLISMSNLASVFWSQGQFKKAEELNKRVVEVRTELFGEGHPDTLTSLSNLASTYAELGQWSDAEDLGLRVVEIKRRVLGEEHPSTLFSLANLASAFSHQGQPKRAEDLEIRVVEMMQRALGREHPSTLVSIANLGTTYMSQGRWEEAEHLYMGVTEISRKVLGDEHPITLTNIDNLGTIFQNTGRCREAEETYLQVLDTREKLLGREHPDTLTSISKLMTVYSDQSRWTEAEELGMQVMEARKRVLGEGHPRTLRSMTNLVTLFRNQERWTEAEDMTRQVLRLTS